MRNGTLALLGLLPVSLLAACEGANAGRQDEDISHVTASIAIVPTGVTCIVIRGSSGNVAINAFTTVPGNAMNVASMNLPFGKLPPGTATFTGAAYTSATLGTTSCVSVPGTLAPDWIADPVTRTLQTGIVTNVELIFHRNNSITTTANFLDNISEIAVGDAASFARFGGSLKQWGLFGIAPGGQSLTPTPVPNLTDVVQVAAGSQFACARRTNGAVSCWGINSNGQLGLPPANLVSTAIPRQVIAGGATDLAVGGAHACAVIGGTVQCWGRNDLGQLGNFSQTDSPTPVLVDRGDVPAIYGPFVRVFASRANTCAIEANHGAAFCWGDDSHGQTGSATNLGFVPLPREVGNAAVFRGIVDLGIGDQHGCALRGDGAVFCWGSELRGRLGTGVSSFNVLGPTAVVGLTDATQLGVGANFSCARREDATAVCWGWGDGGAIGDGSALNQLGPVPVSDLTGVTAVRAHNGSHACAELSNRTVKCWGFNASGQLGDGTTVSRFTPVNVQL